MSKLLTEEKSLLSRLEPPFVYQVYGVTLMSSIPLNLPRGSQREAEKSLAVISLEEGAPEFFVEIIRGVELEQLDGSWYRLGRIADGSIYATWDGVGEFWVQADGSRIVCRRAEQASAETFHVYLLNQALSFALVKGGLEPFHATTVVFRDKAVAFLGDSGYGKSTLAAFLLTQGCKLLTDDLLLLRHTEHGILAQPGPERIKLLPEAARRYMSGAAAGVPMNRETNKLILPLMASAHCPEAVPLAAICSLQWPEEADVLDAVRMTKLTPSQAFLKLLEGTYNYRVDGQERLSRHFEEVASLVSRLPVYELSYPREFSQLPDVQRSIESILLEGANR